MKISLRLQIQIPLFIFPLLNILHGEITFQVFGDFDQNLAINSGAIGVSANGSTIVGYTQYSTSDGIETQAYRFRNDQIHPLGWLTPPEDNVYSRAQDVSDNGEVIAGLSNGPFLWTETSGMVQLEGLNGIARGISGDGSILVGGYYSTEPGFFYMAARWDDGILSDLPSLPSDGNLSFSVAFSISSDGSTIVGHSNSQAIRIKDGKITTLGNFVDEAAFSTSGAYDVSADGSVIVGSGVVDGKTAHFRWTENEMIRLGELSENFSDSGVYGISGDGSTIVGYARGDGALEQEAIIWRESEGYVPVSLNELLLNEGIERGDWQLYSANAISHDGSTIVGEVINSNSNLKSFVLNLGSPAMTWRGFPINSDRRTVDTGSYLGQLDISYDPWIFAYSIDQYIYFPETEPLPEGNWFWAPRLPVGNP